MKKNVTSIVCPEGLSPKHTALFSAVPDERCFPVAQIVEHGASNAKIMGSIPRERKNCNLNAM